jgi:LDH2 family malate/lactate/ureidoglycolate dehydrogenase
MNSSKFWKDAIERAIKTAAQTGVALLSVESISPLDMDWQQIGLTVAMAAVISILTSVASSGVGDNTSASLIK